MPRSRKKKDADATELIVKGVVGVIALLAFAGGGLQGFSERFVGIFVFIALLVVFFGALVGIIYVVRKTDWSTKTQSLPSPLTWPKKSVFAHPDRHTPTSRDSPASVWTEGRILRSLMDIDWYQFEKFCSALLRAEGFTVAREGGAKPDGGVDLITTKNQTKTLIQCKHWKTWKIKESTVRELLGSMVDFEVKKAAVFYSGDATTPAIEFARKHGIGMVDGEALAERALKALSAEELKRILQNETHHCPKCESIMVWRTGAKFKPFWGCSRYPKCRGVLKHTGAK